MKTGDVIDGVEIANIGESVDINDKGEVAFGAGNLIFLIDLETGAARRVELNLDVGGEQIPQGNEVAIDNDSYIYQ